MTEVRVRIVSMGIFWFEARVSHIPRAKSVLAMVAKAGAVQPANDVIIFELSMQKNHGGVNGGADSSKCDVSIERQKSPCWRQVRY